MSWPEMSFLSIYLSGSVCGAALLLCKSSPPSISVTPCSLAHQLLSQTSLLVSSVFPVFHYLHFKIVIVFVLFCFVTFWLASSFFFFSLLTLFDPTLSFHSHCQQLGSMSSPTWIIPVTSGSSLSFLSTVTPSPGSIILPNSTKMCFHDSAA